MDRVMNIAWKTIGGTSLGGFAYEYDAVGRIVSRSQALGTNAFDRVYAYDDLDRLASDGGIAYTYDAAGNRTTKTENGETITYSLGVGDRLASWTDGAYTYDAAGRRIGMLKSGIAFDQDDRIAYAYNNRSELTNAVASVDSAYRYAYGFDDVGNRETSFERGTNSVYAANSLNQYTLISNLCASASLREEFIPQFDNDGNKTLIKTDTGIWQVQYNGENRPILWEN